VGAVVCANDGQVVSHRFWNPVNNLSGELHGCRTGKKHREAEFTADLDLRAFEKRSNGACRSLQATYYCWPVRKIRDAAEGSDSSFAICA